MKGDARRRAAERRRENVNRREGRRRPGPRRAARGSAVVVDPCAGPFEPRFACVVLGVEHAEHA